MDALRTTVRVFTQGAVVVATVTERLIAAVFHCASIEPVEPYDHAGTVPALTTASRQTQARRH